MKRFVSSAVALLAGTVAVGTLVQSASAATITWTSDTSSFSTLNLPPPVFNPSPNNCVNQCSQTLLGNQYSGTTIVDRSPFENSPISGAQLSDYQTNPLYTYSAVQGFPTSAASTASYFLGPLVSSIEILWGSPDFIQ